MSSEIWFRLDLWTHKDKYSLIIDIDYQPSIIWWYVLASFAITVEQGQCFHFQSLNSGNMEML